MKRKLLIAFSTLIFASTNTNAQCTYLKGVIPMPCDECPEEGRHEMLVFRTGSASTTFANFKVYTSSTNPPAETNDYFRNGFVDANNSSISSDLSFYNGVNRCSPNDLFVAADGNTVIPPNSTVIIKNFMNGNVSPAIYSEMACPEGPVYIMYRNLSIDQRFPIFPNKLATESPNFYITAATENGCSKTYSYDPDNLVTDTKDNKLAGAWVKFDSTGNTLTYGNNGPNFPIGLVHNSPAGSICEYPIEVQLPYSISGLSAAIMGNHYNPYTSSSIVINDCQTLGEIAEGNDVIFHIVPTCDSIQIEFKTDQDRYSAYFQEGCLGGKCVFSKIYQFGQTGFSQNARVTPGKDYYLYLDSRIGAEVSRVIDVDISCVDFTTAVKKTNKGNASIFPNPSTGLVHINLDQTATAVTIKVYTISGKLLQQSYQTNVNQTSLNIAEKGIFFIEISTENSTEVLKAIIE